MKMTDYGLILGIVMTATGCLFLYNARKEDRSAVPLSAGLAALFGFCGARLVYWLCSLSVYKDQGMGTLFRVGDGGLAMTGMLLGAAAGCALGAVISGRKILPLLDALTGAIPLLILGERLAEGFVLKQGYGMNLETESLWTVSVFGSPVLNVALIEALVSAVIGGILFVYRKQKPGNTTLLFMILYGLSQVVFESFRCDLHMMWDFVHAQQLFAGLLAIAAVMILSCNGKQRIWTMILSVLMAGMIVVIELGLNSASRVPLPFEWMRQNAKVCWYVIMTALLAAYGARGIRLLTRRVRNER